MTKFITLRVPPAFASGPQFDEDGALVPGSWPAGLPYEGIKGWHQHGSSAQGLRLCDFVAEDDYPVDAIPGGWRATASNMWDMQKQHEYDEDGNLISYAYDTEIPMNQGDYMKHYPDDTEFKVHHVYAGWPDLTEEVV